MSDLKPKRGLGRGLSALMPSAPTAPPVASSPSTAPATSASDPPVPVPAADSARGRGYFAAAIEHVYPSPDQPRRSFADAALDELAASIRTHGVILPLIVRPRAAGGYHLIAGERRWRAAQRAGLLLVPVVVQDVDGRDAFERALIENIQRQDLNALEEAAAYQRLLGEFGMTQEQVAERVGKDRSTVANAVRLLRLPLLVRAMVERDELSMGHARALLALPDAHAIEVAARTIVAGHLSVRAAEELVRRHGQPAAEAKPPRTAPPTKSAAIRDLEQRLTQSLGGPVVIDERVGDARKGGELTIRYVDLDHLDRLLERLL